MEQFLKNKREKDINFNIRDPNERSQALYISRNEVEFENQNPVNDSNEIINDFKKINPKSTCIYTLNENFHSENETMNKNTNKSLLDEDIVNNTTTNLVTIDNTLERNSISLVVSNNEMDDILIFTDQLKDRDLIKNKK